MTTLPVMRLYSHLEKPIRFALPVSRLKAGQVSATTGYQNQRRWKFAARRISVGIVYNFRRFFQPVPSLEKSNAI